MKLKILFIVSFIVSYLLISSCSKEEPVALSETSSEIKVDIELVNNKLKFDNEESLATFLEQTEEKDFKERIKELNTAGFNSLRPILDLEDENTINNYLAQKKSRIAKKGLLYSSKRDSDDIDLEDELIADSNFASILNEDREIYVGDKLYKYTTRGLFYCKIEDERYLKSYLSELSSKIANKALMMPLECEEALKTPLNSDLESMSLNLVEGTVTQITPKISLYSVCSGGGSGGSSDGSSGGSPNNVIPLLVPQNFGTCSYSEDSLFQQVFGNTVKCNDYHDSTHRIQTKVWNENYLIWSSVGASAKYQKKRIIGWSESSTSDGVRLGINHAIYTYETNFSPYNALDPNRVIFKYKGVNYDMTGNVVTTYPINPSEWPFIEKETYGAIEITILGEDLYYPLKGKDANKSINTLLSQARNLINGLSSDMKQDKVGVNIVKFLPNSFQVTQADILLKHSSQAKKIFDFNYLVEWESNSNWGENLLNQLGNSTKYEKIDIDIYGAALRNGVWKGKRIRGKVD